MKRGLKVTITRICRQTTMMPPASLLRAPCLTCGREVETLTAAEVSGFLEIENLTLENLIAAGKIHVTQTAGGSLRFCKDSLFSN